MSSVMPPMCDVAVIGAGLAGALVARQLAQQNLNVVVLDAGNVADGATGSSAGLALFGSPEFHAVLEERHGPAFAAEVWELSAQNLELLAATAQSLGLGTSAVGSFRLIGTSVEAILVQRSVQRLAHLGFNATLEDAMELGYLIGLQTFDDLIFDPAEMTQRLLAHARITLRPRVEVKRLDPDSSGITLKAKRLSLRAKAVVVAAGAFTAQLCPSLAKHLTMLPVQTVECRTAETLPMPLLLDEGRVLLQDRGDFWRLSAYTNPTDEEPWSLLEKYGKRFCPQAVLLRRYTSWVGRSPDGLPLVGQMAEIPHIYTLTGLGPWGLSWAFVATQQLLGLMLHDEDPGLFNVQRFGASPHGRSRI